MQEVYIVEMMLDNKHIRIDGFNMFYASSFDKALQYLWEHHFTRDFDLKEQSNLFWRILLEEVDVVMGEQDYSRQTSWSFSPTGKLLDFCPLDAYRAYHNQIYFEHDRVTYYWHGEWIAG